LPIPKRKQFLKIIHKGILIQRQRWGNIVNMAMRDVKKKRN
jgi:hypothetical protein